MTRTGDREIRSVSGRLPDNPGELACMHSIIRNNQIAPTDRSSIIIGKIYQ